MDTLLRDSPFERVSVLLGIQGDAEISFLPKTDLPFPRPWLFQIQRATSPGEWSDVGSTSESWVAQDLSRYRYDILAESWYRVGLVDADDVVHYSQPIQAGTGLSRHDWLVAREVVRQATQKMRLGSGSDGWLLRRKEWGELCTRCGDEITNQGGNSQCEVCYSTGVVGGYHSPYPISVEWLNEQSSKAYWREPLSRRHIILRPALALGVPRWLAGTVFIEKNTDRRYVAQPDIQVATAIRGLPLVVAVALQPIETTDVIYSFPRPAEQ